MTKKRYILPAIFLFVLIAAAFPTLGYSQVSQKEKRSQARVMNPGGTVTCVDITQPEQKWKELKCTFQEEWEYAYGAHMLNVIEDTAEFAQGTVHKACKERQGCVYGTKTMGERSSLPTALSRTDVVVSNR